MQLPFDATAFLKTALAEDIGSGDVTSEATIPAEMTARFVMNARQNLVVSGLVFLPQLLAMVDARVVVELLAEEGEAVAAGRALARLSGPARALLSGERTALNLVQQLSGVATLTRAYVEAVAGTGAVILDTRKTIPGLRSLQKYAVKCGGGQNHRMGLYDAVLIKDNHIAVAGGVAAAVSAARNYVASLAANGDAGVPLPTGEAGLLSDAKQRFSNPGEGTSEQARTCPHPDLQPTAKERLGKSDLSQGRGAPASRSALTLEVECDTLAQLAEALAAWVDVVLLDNMSNAELREAVAAVRAHNAATGQQVKTEASGNVSLTTVRGIAETGVDAISVGKLTHSAPAVDIGLDEV